MVEIHMSFFEIFRKNLFLKKKSFISLCVNFDTLYNLYTINMAKCENLLFLLPLAVWVWATEPSLRSSLCPSQPFLVAFKSGGKSNGGTKEISSFD